MERSKILGLSLVVASALMVGGCSSGDDASPMNQQKAKDSLAMGGMAYSTLVPIYTDLRNIFNPVAKSSSEVGFDECDEGDFNQSEGNGTLSYTFNECKTSNPNDGFIKPILRRCGVLALLEFVDLQGGEYEDESYYSVINGSVTCTTDETETTETAMADFRHLTVDGYYAQVDDGDDGRGDNHSDWNMHVEVQVPNDNAEEETKTTMGGTIPDGTYRVKLEGSSLWKYWDGNRTAGAALLNDEEWKFDRFDVAIVHEGAGKPDTMTASGKASYEGRVRHGDEENNGMSLYVAFDDLSLSIIQEGTTDDMNVSLEGGVKASCLPAWTYFSTSAVLVDRNATRDADGERMPSSGMMSVTTSETYGRAVAEFGEAEGHAEVNVTVGGKTESYSSWGEMISGSSCEELQEIIDKYLGKAAPAN